MARIVSFDAKRLEGILQAAFNVLFGPRGDDEAHVGREDIELVTHKSKYRRVHSAVSLHIIDCGACGFVGILVRLCTESGLGILIGCCRG